MTSDGLPLVPLGGSSRRRASAAEVAEAARSSYGVDLLDGCRKFADGTGMTRWPSGTPIAAAQRLGEAFLIRLEEGNELVWWTSPRSTDEETKLPVVVVFELGVGAGSAFPQPTGEFSLVVDGETLLRMAPTNRPQRWEGADAVLTFEPRLVRAAPVDSALSPDALLTEESWYATGLALLTLSPGVIVPGGSAELRLSAHARYPSRSWVRVGRSPRPFVSESVLDALDRHLAPRHHPKVQGWSVVFGDIHNHSGETLREDGIACGKGAREELFRYARDVSGLDFFCLSEHDWQMGAKDWEHLKGLNKRYDEPNRFAVLTGFEWTSASYGHRNIYFRDSDGILFQSAPVDWPLNHLGPGAPTPEDLWSALDEAGSPAITVPHHMSLAEFPLSLEEFHSERYDKVAEIYSSWGDSLEHDPDLTLYADRISELAFLRAIRSGRRVGFIASSDSHDGHPGNAQGGAPDDEVLFHHRGSGFVAALVHDLDRKSVFDSLAARRSYGLTGGDIVMSVTLADQPMGSEITSRSHQVPPLSIELGGSVPITSVSIYRNAEVVAVERCQEREVDFEWSDPHPLDEGWRSYFVKARRSDGEVAWSSPIWIDRAH